MLTHFTALHSTLHPPTYYFPLRIQTVIAVVIHANFEFFSLLLLLQPLENQCLESQYTLQTKRMTTIIILNIDSQVIMEVSRIKRIQNLHDCSSSLENYIPHFH